MQGKGERGRKRATMRTTSEAMRANSSFARHVTSLVFLLLTLHAKTATGLALRMPPKLTKTTQSIQHIAGRTFFPPIPPQEEQHVTVLRQFEPRFVAREFLLGVRCMLRALPFLMGASIFVTSMRLLFLTASPPQSITSISRPLQTASQTSSLQRLESMVKMHLLGFMTMSSPRVTSMAYYIMICPATEEVCYRGIGHFVGAIGAEISLIVFASISRLLSPRVALGLEALQLIVSTWPILSSGLYLPEVAVCLSSIVTLALVLPAKLEIAKVTKEERAARKNSATRCKENDDTGSRRLAISRSARWRGASRFGAAHVSVGNIDLVTKTREVQKCFGTLCSSLLIESRLAVIRRTIWGSIGAHATYNLLATPSLVWIVGAAYGLPLQPLGGVAHVAIGLTICTRLLGHFEKAIARMEMRLL